MNYLANAFSIQMLDNNDWINHNVQFTEISEEEFRTILKRGYKSCIGHQDLANILGVEFNRESISLNVGDNLLVAQLVGGRLAEGTTELPKGFSMKYIYVEIM